MARQVLPIAGAIVGAYFGNPQLGWAIGSAIGNAVDPQVIKGPSIGDIAEQTSQEGVPRPIIYGRSPPIAGNIIAKSEPRIVRRRQRQSKGGPKVETESVYRTYAIRVCEGPIFSFSRVWRNGILVYDATPNSLLSKESNNQFLLNARFFNGTYTQNPSPDLEAIFGVGTTPAHRGTAYMVMADEDLTDLRGAIPQFLFQVNQATQQDSRIVYEQDGIWLKPPGLSSIDVRMVAGGGGGASGGVARVGSFPRGGGGGGGGGAGEITIVADDLDDLVSVTVGGGGGGGSAVTSSADFSVLGLDGSNGSGSSFGGHISVAGGGGGEVNGVSTGGIGGAGVPNNTWNGGHGGTALTGVGKATTNGPGGGGLGGVEYAGIVTDGPVAGGTGPTSDAVVISGGAAGTDAVGTTPAVPGSSGLPGDDYRPGSGGGGGGGAWRSNSFVPDFSVDGSAGGPGGNYGGGGGGGGGVYRAASGDAATSGAGGSGSAGVVVVDQFFDEDLPDLTEATVVSDICLRAGLREDLIDVTALTRPMHGLAITNSYPAMEALRAISQVNFFDPANYDGIVHFVRRGGNSVATITENDMLDDDEDIEQDKRSDSISIPRVLHLNYFDVDGGLATDKQSIERSGDRRSNGEMSLQSPVLMTADEAARATDINLKVMVESQKGELKFRLPDSFIRLATTNPIILQWQGRSVRAMIHRVDTFDGYQEYVAVRDRQSAYTSNVEGIPAAPQTPPPSSVVGPTLFQFLDTHILRDADDNAGLIYYVAVSGVLPAWQGAEIELSIDGGENYIDSATTRVSAVIGETISVLDDHPQAFPDTVNVVRVRIETPFAELLETTLTGMLNGENLAILGDELINFANADEVSQDVWDLSYFLRGRKGTETQEHPVGTRFVLLDRSSLAMIPASIADIGRTFTFRATSFGATTDSGTVVHVTYEGRSQIERQPAYLSAHMDGSNVDVSWQGVGRLGGGASVAQGIRFSGYRVTVDDGADQITQDTLSQSISIDVSSLTAPLTIRVQQLNDLTGVGPAAEVTIE